MTDRIHSVEWQHQPLVATCVDIRDTGLTTSKRRATTERRITTGIGMRMRKTMVRVLLKVMQHVPVTMTAMMMETVRSVARA